MPDISLRGAHEYWKSYRDKLIYRVVSFMESVENWAIDGNQQIEDALAVLGNNLDGISKFELKKHENYVEILSYLKMSRTLRIMQAIDTAHPGSASRLLMYSEENSKSGTDLPGIFLKRNVAFERLRLLTRVFSSERFALVTKTLEGDDE